VTSADSNSQSATHRGTLRADEAVAVAERYSAHNYAPLPVVLSEGLGSWVTDTEGRRYLDCISAYSSLNQGHRHPRIVAALHAQAERLTLTSRAVHNDQMGAFLETLCTLTGYEKALPMNTGAEAVETAIKIARKWGYTRKRVARDRAEIIVCHNNFHGRTTTIVGFSTEPQYREDFGPYGPGFVSVPFGDVDALEQAITANTVAFLAEPIQAEAGIIMPPKGYLAAARAICGASNVLFMLDEIQTGLGRTGQLFAYEHEADAKPDVLILGKALGGGVYPVSAALASADVMDVIGPGDHGSTFGGNPLAAAVARAALEVVVDENLSERARKLGENLMSSLGAMTSEHVSQVRGSGLLIGIEVRRSSGTARRFAERLMAERVLCKDTHEQVLRIAPPLTTASKDIEWLGERLRRIFSP
jgi:ornithine--oxo-acid transaminase